jgi:hypothetical protein
MQPMRATAGWMILVAAMVWLGPAASAATAAQKKQPPRHTNPRRAALAHSRHSAAPAVVAAVSARRDPFAPLISDLPGKSVRVARPPGKAGLAIDEIQVQGTVRGPHGAVAVVSSPNGHVYFLRAGDKLFDGKVARIEGKGVEFIQHSRDVLGREFDRQVVKSVQPTGGVKR